MPPIGGDKAPGSAARPTMRDRLVHRFRHRKPPSATHSPSAASAASSATSISASAGLITPSFSTRSQSALETALSKNEELWLKAQNSEEVQKDKHWPKFAEQFVAASNSPTIDSIVQAFAQASDGSPSRTREIYGRFVDFANGFKDVGAAFVALDTTKQAAAAWALLNFLVTAAVKAKDSYSIARRSETVASVKDRTEALANLYLNSSVIDRVIQDNIQTLFERLYIKVLRYVITGWAYIQSGKLSHALKSLIPYDSVRIAFDALTDAEQAVRVALEPANAKLSFHTNEISLKVSTELERLQQPLQKTFDEVSALYRDLLEQQCDRILSWLSEFKEGHRLNELIASHMAGTGSWLLSHNDFVTWRGSTESALLLLDGRMGTGKSTLVALAISDHIKNFRASETGLWAYYFCDKTSVESRKQMQDPSNILRCLLRQILENSDISELSDVLELYNQRKRSGRALTREEITDLIIATVERLKKVTFVIDAVDECEAESGRNLIDCLSDLRNHISSVFKVLISCRTGHEIGLYLQQLQPRYCIQVENDGDIEAYIQETTMKHIEESAFKTLLTEECHEISRVLTSKAHGQFRYAAFALDYLGKRGFAEDIHVQVAALPPKLADLYDRSYNEVEDQDVSYTYLKSTISILQCQRVELTTSELLEAVFEPRTLQCIDAPHRLLLKACANFVELDEQAHRFRLTHSSVKDYFDQHPHFQLDDIHGRVAQLCLGRLRVYFAPLFPGEDQFRFQYRWSRGTFVSYALCQWPSHVTHGPFEAGTDDAIRHELDAILQGLNPCYGDLIAWFESGIELLHINKAFQDESYIDPGIGQDSLVARDGTLESVSSYTGSIAWKKRIESTSLEVPMEQPPLADFINRKMTREEAEDFNEFEERSRSNIVGTEPLELTRFCELKNIDMDGIEYSSPNVAAISFHPPATTGPEFLLAEPSSDHTRSFANPLHQKYMPSAQSEDKRLDDQSSASLEASSPSGYNCDLINPSTGKLCNVEFSRPYDLQRHEDLVHDHRGKLQCPYCIEETTFSRVDALTKHVRVIHPQASFMGKAQRYDLGAIQQVVQPIWKIRDASAHSETTPQYSEKRQRSPSVGSATRQRSYSSRRRNLSRSSSIDSMISVASRGSRVPSSGGNSRRHSMSAGRTSLDHESNEGGRMGIPINTVSSNFQQVIPSYEGQLSLMAMTPPIPPSPPHYSPLPLDDLVANITSATSFPSNALFAVCSWGLPSLLMQMEPGQIDAWTQRNLLRVTPLLAAIQQVPKAKGLCYSMISMCPEEAIHATAESGLTPLHAVCGTLASEDDLFDINLMARRLLQRSARVNAETESGETPLHFAVRACNPRLVSILLQAGADIDISNEKSYSSFWSYIASSFMRSGSLQAQEMLEIVKILALENGSLLHGSVKGCNLLHVAAAYDSMPLAKAVVSVGIDVNSKAEIAQNSTALHIAANGPFSPIIKWLLDVGADVDARDDCGRTPLHCAASMDAASWINTFLIIRGLAFEPLDDLGRTPLDAALERGASNAVEYFLDIGLVPKRYCDADLLTLSFNISERCVLLLLKFSIYACVSIDICSQRAQQHGLRSGFAPKLETLDYDLGDSWDAEWASSDGLHGNEGDLDEDDEGNLRKSRVEEDDEKFTSSMDAAALCRYLDDCVENAIMLSTRNTNDVLL